MSVFFPGDDPDRILLVARMLATDLQQITAGGPSSSELKNAPILDHWRLAQRAQTSLIGLSHGHPHIRSGRPTMTSALIAIDIESGWARTWSRYYLLGRPADLTSGRAQ